MLNILVIKLFIKRNALLFLIVWIRT